MSQSNQTPREYSRSSTYRDLRVTTYFDRKGRVIQVSTDAIEPEPVNGRSIASLIDSTLLKPDATADQVTRLCQDALEKHFFAVCVNPYWVPLCVNLLSGTEVKVATVVGFPLGATTTEIKVFEAKSLIKLGADELDMVINIGELKKGNFANVANDMREVVRAAHKHDVLVKVIIETCLLTEQEKISACLLARQAGIDFVKTSTGFSGPGATVEDVALMRAVVGESIGVKAAGGIRNYADAKKMVAAGATRIGTSAGVQIVEEEVADLAGTNL